MAADDFKTTATASSRISLMAMKARLMAMKARPPLAPPLFRVLHKEGHLLGPIQRVLKQVVVAELFVC